MTLFLFAHAALLAALAGAALGAGAVVTRGLRMTSRPEALALRAAAGLAALATLACGLGLAGRLDRLHVSLAALAGFLALPLALRGPRGPDPSRERRGRRAFSAVAVVALLPLFVLALYPPLAFDETLYHLPTVKSFAESGSLPFLPSLRAPVFPHLDEVLRVPLYLAGGDTATHLVPLLATLVTALLVFAWAGGGSGSGSGSGAGGTAAALLLSGPIVVSLAVSGYVEAFLAMFVTAALFSFSRWDASRELPWLLATAVFAGAAAGVKYLGLYWLGLLGLAVLVRSRRGERLRHAALFGAASLAALAPWYGRILFYTHSPLFPYLPSVFGPTEWDPVPGESLGLRRRLLDVLRVPWDTLFARERVNSAPPFSPWLALSIPLVLLHAKRSRRTAALAAAGFSWALVWAWLPHDARYLALLLPAASVATATALHESPLLRAGFQRPILAALLILAPGPLYALYRIVLLGPLPTNAASRDAFYSRHLPEWAGISFLAARAAPDDVTFVWGCEQLRYHLRGKVIGDHTGPAHYARIERTRTAVELAELLRAHHVRTLLVASRASAPQLGEGAGTAPFRLLFRDAAVRVYRLD